MKRILFIDRDGTLIEEPADEQIDSFEKLKFVKGVFRNLSFIRQHLDFEFVMVSNQDGLGTASFPEDTFWPVHNFILQTLEGEGITFDEILIDPHFPEDNAPTRKPNTGLVEKYMNNPEYDIANSYVVMGQDLRDTFCWRKNRRSEQKDKRNRYTHQGQPRWHGQVRYLYRIRLL